MAEVPVGADGEPLTHSQMASSLTSAKESRKRAELDAQLLANRIALLKQEEEKAWKKIEETRKRAEQITITRAKNESKFAAKEQFYKDKWETIRQQQAANQTKRDNVKAVRDAARRGLEENKYQNYVLTKQQSQQFLQQKKDMEERHLQANASRSALIRQRKEEAKRKLEEDRLNQLEKFREDYEARTAQEEMLRARTDALVHKMEQEEMELIQRLQNTQSVQRNAYENLEAALGQTSQQISSSAGYPGGGGGGGFGGKAHGGYPAPPRPAA